METDTPMWYVSSSTPLLVDTVTPDSQVLSSRRLSFFSYYVYVGLFVLSPFQIKNQTTWD